MVPAQLRFYTKSTLFHYILSMKFGISFGLH